MSNDMQLNYNKIQQLRMQKFWSQEELASASDLSVRTIQRVEKSGNASLETTKALASVFETSPFDLQSGKNLQHATFVFICKYAWLVAFAVSSVLFGAWVIDILIPTLKGADFNHQYEMHGNFRYLDFGGISFFISFFIGFTLLGVNVLMEYLNRKELAENFIR